MLISAVQQSDSVIHTHTHTHTHILFHYGLSQDNKYNLKYSSSHIKEAKEVKLILIIILPNTSKKIFQQVKMKKLFMKLFYLIAM